MDTYAEDLELLLASRHANGADFWATPEGKLGIEKPISTLIALLTFSELRVPKEHEALRGAAELVLNACTSDGRVRIAPKGSVYPCHTASAAAALCRNGFADEPRVQAMLEYLMDNRYEDGGWRCKKFSFGRGPETDFSNPGVTLFALDAFRCAGAEYIRQMDRAVETLLDHWTVRAPIGPCHYGMGERFMQVEYPFFRYNLFYYVFVLSFYPYARGDARFLEALEALQKKLGDRGRMIVESPKRSLAGMRICRKGEPSEAATARYREILQNMALD